MNIKFKELQEIGMRLVEAEPGAEDYYLTVHNQYKGPEVVFTTEFKDGTKNQKVVPLLKEVKDE